MDAITPHTPQSQDQQPIIYSPYTVFRLEVRSMHPCCCPWSARGGASSLPLSSPLPPPHPPAENDRFEAAKMPPLPPNSSAAADGGSAIAVGSGAPGALIDRRLGTRTGPLPSPNLSCRTPRAATPPPLPLPPPVPPPLLLLPPANKPPPPALLPLPLPLVDDDDQTPPVYRAASKFVLGDDGQPPLRHLTTAAVQNATTRPRVYMLGAACHVYCIYSYIIL
jgi:hypothetical protein